MSPRRRALCVFSIAVCLLPVASQAHAILVESEPPADASVPAGPVTLRLRYNSRIDAARSRLTLTAPDGTQSVLPSIPASGPDLLSAEATLAPGKYSVRWQVLAIDGHITRGDVPFTVTP